MSEGDKLTVTIPVISERNRDVVCCSSPFQRKERVRCLFCGGDQCKRCGPTAYLQLEKPAIPNLHSTWINDSIIAMQRPSDVLFVQGNVLEGLRTARITAVFNLTEPGEHPYCGSGILETSGFPYTPEKLMAVGIKHFNFHWQDMTAPSIAKMTEIAHLGAMELNKGGKIAVHCHAGYGRTGMAIACILIVKDQVESAQVIQFIRNRRPGSIQTSAQEGFIRKFEKSYRFLMQSFPTKESLELSASNNDDSKGVLSYNSVTAKLAASGISSGMSSPRSSHASSALYLKSIAQSLRDQQYLLSPLETASKQFLWIQKLVYYTCLAMRTLCKDAVPLAHFGITGLNKLVPRENNSHKFTSNISKGNLHMLMSAPSYMVATNSMNQGLEETLLTDIKMEINCNKWTRFLSVADVVAISLQLGHESVKRLTKVTSNLDEFGSGSASRAGSQKNMGFGAASVKLNSAGANCTSTSLNNTPATVGSESLKHDGTSLKVTAPPSSAPAPGPLSIAQLMVTPTSPPTTAPTSSQRVNRSPSMFRANSLKDTTTEADFSKSKRVSANIMSQLLLDWLETRKDSVLQAADVAALGNVWKKFYPDFGVLGWATPAWRDAKARTRGFQSFISELTDTLKSRLERCKLEVLSCLVALFHSIHTAGVDNNAEEGQNEAPTMDALVALRLAVALMHARKLNYKIIHNRSLCIDLVKVFMLKHADAEPVIINNITFAHDHAEIATDTIGRELMGSLEVLVRTLLVLQETEWVYKVSSLDIISWRAADTVEEFAPF